MGSDYQSQIPVIDFSTINSVEVDRGTEEWYHLCEMVREACECYGCFEAVYDKITRQLRAESFSMIRQLFSLPLETKQKNFNPKPYHGYAGGFVQIPLYESFGIEDSSNYESVKSFTKLMWPNGNSQFCNTVTAMTKRLEELNHIIECLILDSYGVKAEKISPNSVIMECKTLLRVMKYRAPPESEDMIGLHPHVDKLKSTILCDDQIAALEVETKDGQWLKLSPSPHSYIFLVGDPLMAWSNGRMHAVRHRVMMSGEKDRYSLAGFTVPIEGTIVKPPKELVDEQHPPILKEFDFMDFLMFAHSDQGRAIDSEKQLFSYAGI